MRIGAVITREREALGLDLSELARRAGMAPAVLSRIESGRRKPAYDSLVAIEAALAMEPGTLMRLAHPAPDAGAHLDTLRWLGIPEHKLAEFRQFAPYMSEDDWEDVIATARRRAEKQGREQQPGAEMQEGQRKAFPNERPQVQARGSVAYPAGQTFAALGVSEGVPDYRC